MSPRLRTAIIAVSILAVGYVASLQFFPNAADCAASGRVADSALRHCTAADGSYDQLREHIVFHTRDVLLGAGLLGLIGFGLWTLLRRRRRDQR